MWSIASKILDRSVESLLTLKKYIEGVSPSSFFMEKTKLPAGGLTWWEQEVSQKDDDAKTNVGFAKSVNFEFTEAYALQRDVNYLYSERKRLFETGLDSKLDNLYYAGYQASVAEKKSS